MNEKSIQRIINEVRKIKRGLGPLDNYFEAFYN